MADSSPPASVPARSRVGLWILAIFLFCIAAVVAFYVQQPGSWIAGWSPALWARIAIAAAIAMGAGYVVAQVFDLPAPPAPGSLDLVTPEEYVQQ
ncbi:MAG TPA: hypothetical protein VFG20_19535, partial [Planctomycetaceae bacterium]|nr:hypothetical protein [Planctomycetaceae bacterium]